MGLNSMKVVVLGVGVFGAEFSGVTVFWAELMDMTEVKTVKCLSRIIVRVA
jgi:hypothetical protein